MDGNWGQLISEVAERMTVLVEPQRLDSSDISDEQLHVLQHRSLA